MVPTFPITSTSATVSQLPIGEERKVIEPSILRWVETQYLEPPKAEGIVDSSSQHEDKKHRHDEGDISSTKDSTIL